MLHWVPAGTRVPTVVMLMLVASLHAGEPATKSRSPSPASATRTHSEKNVFLAVIDVVFCDFKREATRRQRAMKKIIKIRKIHVWFPLGRVASRCHRRLPPLHARRNLANNKN